MSGAPELLFAEMVREKDVLRAILDWLNCLPNTRAWRRNVGGATAVDANGKKRFIKFGERGQADIWGITSGGRHFEIECKAPGQKATVGQIAWLQECARRGAFCFVADSLDTLIVEWRKAGL